MARSSKLESGFQDRLIAEIKDMFPGCMVFKMDQIQGIPDLLILYGKRWASLENKKSATVRSVLVWTIGGAIAIAAFCIIFFVLGGKIAFN